MAVFYNGEPTLAGSYIRGGVQEGDVCYDWQNARRWVYSGGVWTGPQKISIGATGTGAIGDSGGEPDGSGGTTGPGGWSVIPLSVGHTATEQSVASRLNGSGLVDLRGGAYPGGAGSQTIGRVASKYVPAVTRRFAIAQNDAAASVISAWVEGADKAADAGLLRTDANTVSGMGVFFDGVSYCL